MGKKYRVTYDMENVVEIEDGHDLTDDEVEHALKEAMNDDVKNNSWEGYVSVTELGDEPAEPTYKMRVIANPPAYPNGPRVISYEGV